MKYDELGYSLPKMTADAAAARAITILEEIAKADAGCLFYVMQASNILALAGLRAQSPYNDFEPSFGFGRQFLLDKILRQHGCAIMNDSDPYVDNARNTFSVMCSRAFKDLPHSYSFISSFWKGPRQVGDLTDFVLWSDHFQMTIVQKIEEGELPKDWLLDWWAPSHIRFGMLLGYPGQAISASCWNEARHYEGKPEKELTASIPFQGVYCGAHVNYNYLRGLQDDPVMKAHQALWTSVLTQVYDAFPESRVMKLPEFKKTYEAYKKYDQTAR